ncbi:hypothetical protein BDQ12DRAFT_678902 [Crucibulum laeve]|uniref:Uncharacterized protein n=1 Tax=Crucibulum laeve TaxID=68775 RepID=A0A5C3M6M5_9AGAR|nr:hypothetical protein BDQ12DRAFT_678902 [Crucibulum laeve]
MKYLLSTLYIFYPVCLRNTAWYLLLILRSAQKSPNQLMVYIFKKGIVRLFSAFAFWRPLTVCCSWWLVYCVEASLAVAFGSPRLF